MEQKETQSELEAFRARKVALITGISGQVDDPTIITF